ncbi:cell division protein FtsL [Desulfatirhabdium butyrativorans]|uniref:cell division protein FtsL n=1 Tax=Desulfatirhabdium butyrativorans TaxID=340467 RepID=UPI0004865144|nr:cell division protein FtsL [Desulfatirhabdium butyrativorans]
MVIPNPDTQKHQGRSFSSGGWEWISRFFRWKSEPPEGSLGNSRLSATIDSLPAGRLTALLLLIMATLFEAIIFVKMDIRDKKIQKEIVQELQRNQSLMILENNLDIEIAGLSSPERIAQIARDQFGLSTPSHEQLQVLP